MSSPEYEPQKVTFSKPSDVEYTSEDSPPYIPPTQIDSGIKAQEDSPPYIPPTQTEMKKKPTFSVVDANKTTESVKKPNTIKAKHDKKGIYMLHVITRNVHIPFEFVGSNLKEILQKKLERELEGKCSVEGYIKPNSVRVMNYSSGILKSGNVVFDVVIECLVCNPVENMKFKVVVRNITKAGIRADSGSNSPVDVFIARDHFYNNKYFNSVSVGDEIIVRVIGQRYEIYDPRISVIAELVKPKKKTKKNIVFEDDE